MNDPDHKQHELGPEPAAVDVAMGHEMSDVSVRGLVVFLTGLVVSLAVVVFAVAWLFSYFRTDAEQHDPPVPPLSRLRSAAPPGPRLQQSPADEMETMRKQQDDLLSKHEWIDKDERVVRIPIDRAIELIGEGKQALPKWPPVKDDNGKSSSKAESSTESDTAEDRP
jgi:hypothetical protein